MDLIREQKGNSDKSVAPLPHPLVVLISSTMDGWQLWLLYCDSPPSSITF